MAAPNLMLNSGEKTILRGALDKYLKPLLREQASKEMVFRSKDDDLETIVQHIRDLIDVADSHVVSGLDRQEIELIMIILEHYKELSIEESVQWDKAARLPSRVASVNALQKRFQNAISFASGPAITGTVFEPQDVRGMLNDVLAHLDVVAASEREFSDAFLARAVGVSLRIREILRERVIFKRFLNKVSRTDYKHFRVIAEQSAFMEGDEQSGAEDFTSLIKVAEICEQC